MAESNIWKFDDRILLPDVHHPWLPITASQRLSLNIAHSPLGPNFEAVPHDVTKAYFLAEIAMCRMLRRCTTSVTQTRNQEVYAPIIAAELANQLERWYEHLPSSIRFQRQTHADFDSSLTFSAEDMHDVRTDDLPQPLYAAVTLYLQTQFYACRTSIYWPAVFGAIHTEASISATLLLTECTKFYDAYTSFVQSAAAAIPCCPLNAWYMYAR